MPRKNPRVARLFRELSALGNDVFKTREYRNFLSVKLTRKRAAYYIFERSHFHLNRRQCWALVQARAPFDIKQLIWHHEMEELEGDKERGVENHLVLGMQEGAAVGLKPRDFKKPPSDGTLICTHAWSHVAEHAPWLEALASSCMLEIANSDGIVRGGGIAARFGRKMARDLKIPLSRQPSNKEHMEVDIIHANLLFEAAERHVTDREAYDLAVSGAKKGLSIYKNWLGLTAIEMERIK
ncbi:MAG: iron-containing redox enzyme family protein [Pseudomonadota bacterium]|nr:iron-containing redox enzyme family protein [Pseudomonadota bacterium]